MGVAAQRERRGMVSERPAHGDDGRAFAQVDSREGVPKGVEGGPPRPCLLDQRLQHPPAQSVGIQEATVVGSEDEIGRLARLAVEPSPQLRTSGGGRRTTRRPCFDFGGTIRPLT